MKNMLYIAAILLTILTSCEKESVYDVTAMSLEEAIDLYKEDALAHGINVDDYNITIGFGELPDGYAGTAAGNNITINENYWRGNTTNLNTVYHEYGHVFGLMHGSTNIMSPLSASNTVMTHVEDYWELIQLKLGKR